MTGRFRLRLLAVAVASLSAWTTTAQAHPTGLATLVVSQSAAEATRWDAVWRTAARGPRAAPPDAPEGCATIQEARETLEGTSRVVRLAWRCPSVLEGELSLGGSDLDVMATLRWADGTQQFGRLTPERQTMTIRAPDAAASDAGDGEAGVGTFFGLGFEHVLGGADHLLFVALLLLIAWPAGARLRIGAVAGAITGFTVGHSVTLGFGAAGWLSGLPQSAVEATIAWSVVVAAAAVARRPPGDGPEAPRAGALLGASVGFGLLHGLGFAGALREVLPPDAGLAGPLLGFNLGVEAGQLAFAAAAMVVIAGLRRIAAAEAPRRVDVAVSYAGGTIAAMWMFERLVG